MICHFKDSLSSLAIPSFVTDALITHKLFPLIQKCQADLFFLVIRRGVIFKG